MKWSDWPELIPDPHQVDASGGVRLEWQRPSPAIQRRLEVFGRRHIPVRRELQYSRFRRAPFRQRLRLAAGLVVLALMALVGRRA